MAYTNQANVSAWLRRSSCGASLPSDTAQEDLLLPASRSHRTTSILSFADEDIQPTTNLSPPVNPREEIERPLRPGLAHCSLLKQQRQHARETIERVTATFVKDLYRLAESTTSSHNAVPGASATASLSQASPSTQSRLCDDFKTDGIVSTSERSSASDEILPFDDEGKPESSDDDILYFEPDETVDHCLEHLSAQKLPALQRDLAGSLLATFSPVFEISEGEFSLRRAGQRGPQRWSRFCPDPPASSGLEADQETEEAQSENPITTSIARRAQLQLIPGACYPNRAVSSTRRLAQLYRVLQEMHRCLCTGQVITKRDLYYRAPALFGSQAVTDRIVGKVRKAIGVRRSALGVVATSKGLITGSARIVLLALDGDDVENHQAGPELLVSHGRSTLIPHVDTIDYIETGAQWVLIVEKDAIFQLLAQTRITDAKTAVDDDVKSSLIDRVGLIITAKGYPDVNTREFLMRLRAEHSEIPMYALVDADPHGLDIYEKYRTSLMNLPGEGLQLLGLTLADLQISPALHRGINPAHLSIQEHMLPLTTVDERKAHSMLREGTQTPLPPLVRSELVTMIQLGLKAEIETLIVITETHARQNGHADHVPHDVLTHYLQGKLGVQAKKVGEMA